MLHLTGIRHTHHQALCKQLPDNSSRHEECNTQVIVRFHIRARSNGGTYGTRPITWGKGSGELSFSLYEVHSELSELSRTPRCFKLKPGLLLMNQ